MPSASFFALAALAAGAVAAPTSSLIDIKTVEGQTSGRYIVKFKDGASATTHLSNLRTTSSSTNITNQYRENFFNGFAAEFDEDSLNALRGNSDVEYIEEDGVVTTFVTQDDAPWGLSRLSQQGPVSGSVSDLDYQYTYDSSAGSGVDIYIVDTGIYTDHEDFGGRASWGATFGGYQDADGNGHGTHVAGTAAGTRWGVAKAASLFAVKVLDDSGSGFVSDIVSGLDFVASSAESSGNPSIASLSLGGSASTSLDSAVESAVSGGVHFTVAAGNSATDASSTSPARVAVANTIGASTITDSIASFSNYGSIVDVFAPGVSVTSAWNNGGTNTISGTSMATPHVAGLIAYLISVNGNGSPAEISDLLVSLAVEGALSGIPGSTPNLLVNNGN